MEQFVISPQLMFENLRKRGYSSEDLEEYCGTGVLYTLLTQLNETTMDNLDTMLESMDEEVLENLLFDFEHISSSYGKNASFLASLKNHRKPSEVILF